MEEVNRGVELVEDCLSGVDEGEKVGVMGVMESVGETVGKAAEIGGETGGSGVVTVGDGGKDV